MKISYEWLQTFFEKGALPSVEEVEQKLMFHAYEIEGVEEVGEDSVIDVDVLPNRAADSLSHRGVAREVSTLFNIPMKRDPLRESISLESHTDAVTVSTTENDSCSYYVGAYIKRVTVKESPDWLRKRLEAIGQKSINNIVDATNYVLFELGRPTHVFDTKKLEGDVPSVATRLAKDGEKITLLGGDEVTLTEQMTVIIDAQSDAPIAIAGVKGGAVAEVDEHTTDVFVEVANFHPTQTRLTAQALKLRTDASARFENNIADTLADYGAVAVVDLILQVAGGELVGYAAAGALGDGNISVKVPVVRVSKLLGADVSKEEIEDIFTRLQFEYSIDGEVFTVTAPFERRDITIPEDVIEEIGRVYGYEKIESKQLDETEKSIGINKTFAYSEIIRNALTGIGITEVYLYSLRDSGEVKLRNALASDKNYMRSNLSDGVVESLEKNTRNMPLLGLYDIVQIFEIGKVFTNEKEETHVCVGVNVSGSKKKAERVRARLEEIKEELERVLGVPVSYTTENENTLEFSLGEIIDTLPEITAYPWGGVVSGDISYIPISTYPFVLRDIAVWVPKDTAISEIQDIIKKHAGVLLKRLDIFDEFEKDGRVSYAFHLVFQSVEKTLTDEEIGKIMNSMEEEIENKDGWEVR